MLVGKRLIAFSIDFSISIFSGMFVVAGIESAFSSLVHYVSNYSPNIIDTYYSLLKSPFVGFSVLFFWAIGWYSLLWGVTIHKTKRTLGKLLLGLEVTYRDGKKLSFGHAIGRELIKAVSVIIPLLWVFFLLQLIFSQQTYYDQVFNSAVYLKNKQSKIQENFRRYYEKR